MKTIFLINKYTMYFIIYQYIIAFIIIITILYPSLIIQYSQYSLGKLFAVLLLIYFTSIDKMYGIAMLVYIIIFYSIYDYKKGFLTVEMFSVGSRPLLFQTPTKEGFNENDEDNKDDKNNKNIPKNKDSFKQKYCKHGKLQHKGVNVPNEMISHVFPYINFKNKGTCNICNEGCGFDLQKEEQLKKPVNSNDWIEPAMAHFNKVKTENFTPFISKNLKQISKYN